MLLVIVILNNNAHLTDTKSNKDFTLMANYEGVTYSLTDTANNPISSVTLTLKVKPYFDGPVTLWTATGSYTAKIKNSNGVTVATISSRLLFRFRNTLHFG
jgi:hypothetical protein